MQPYYKLPQAPGKFQNAVVEAPSNIYDEVEKERIAANGYVCGLPVLPFAYLVCIYMIFEGLYILLNDLKRLGLGLAGPFHASETGFLEFVAWGDIVAASLGSMGIWFSQNIFGVGWRQISKMHSTVAILGSGAALAWRTLVCLGFAPWAGIMLAFSTPNSDKVSLYLLVAAYIAFSIFLVYVLAMSFRQCVSDSRRFQQHLDTQAVQERQQLLMTAGSYRQDPRNPSADGEAMRDHEIEPELFGILPLAESVTVYTILVAVASLWAFTHLILTGGSSGGWAFFAYTPRVASTFWIEAFLWPASFFCAVLGMAGASSFSGSGFIEEKPSTSSVLIFLLASMLRFALLFAVTGMDLVEKNTCGIYMSLANLGNLMSPATGIWIHCSGPEYLLLGGMLVCCALDAYLIWATFQLWHHAQDWIFGDYVETEVAEAPWRQWKKNELSNDQWVTLDSS